MKAFADHPRPRDNEGGWRECVGAPHPCSSGRSTMESNVPPARAHARHPFARHKP
jgi:hypothetical protein